MDSYGNDITGTYVKNFLECRDLCSRAEKCIMYGMWIRRKLCWLKHTINAQLTHQNGFVVSNASCTGDDIQMIFTM